MRGSSQWRTLPRFSSESSGNPPGLFERDGYYIVNAAVASLQPYRLEALFLCAAPLRGCRQWARRLTQADTPGGEWSIYANRFRGMFAKDAAPNTQCRARLGMLSPEGSEYAGYLLRLE